MPLLIPNRVVDLRQRHWLDTDRTNSLDGIVKLCEAVPDDRVVVTDCYISANSLVQEDGSLRYPGLYFDSRNGGAGLSGDLAEGHILFGSGAPLRSVTPGLLKLGALDMDETGRERVEPYARWLIPAYQVPDGRGVLWW